MFLVFKCYVVLLGVNRIFKKNLRFFLIKMVQTAHFYDLPSQKYNHFRRIYYGHFVTGVPMPVILRLCHRLPYILLHKNTEKNRSVSGNKL